MTMTRAEIQRLQNDKLNALLDEVVPRNAFYVRKFAGSGLTRDDIRTVADLRRLPFTTKDELLEEQRTNPPYGSLLTYPVSRYTRFHQTSGTSGQPLRWLDTNESWSWVVGCWTSILRLAGVHAEDRLLFAFSFGPFLGFWSAFEAASAAGCLCLPGGGLSSAARLRMLLDNQATVVLCTPTYALRLAEVAAEQGIRLADSKVRLLIVAGEPGGSIPETRARIENAWRARVLDHSGMTETGPLSIECPERLGGLQLLETDYIAEVIDPGTGEPAPAGQVGELVLTNLGRAASPLLRYRTGDLVRIEAEPTGCSRLAGGILGRTDDMIHIRGNNIYPSVLENVIRRFAEVVEYRILLQRSDPQTQVKIEVEPAGAHAGLAERLGQTIRDELLFRPEVSIVPPGSLPRFEMKARRIVYG
jgi:phenylacetate-CoA ligase